MCNVQCAMCNVQCAMQTVQKPTNKFSLKPFSKGLQGCGDSVPTNRRRRTPALLGVSPADCFWKRGILAENAPKYDFEPKLPRRSKAAQ